MSNQLKTVPDNCMGDKYRLNIISAFDRQKRSTITFNYENYGLFLQQVFYLPNNATIFIH